MQPDVLKLTGSEAGSVRLSEVGGWLLLFCFIYTILTPAGALLEIISDPQSSAPIVFLAVLSFVTGISVWRRASRALQLTKLMLVVFFGVGLLGLVLGIISASNDADWVEIDLMAEAVIWFLYFKRSKRVRATFGRSL
jgi:hypothetical protein